MVAKWLKAQVLDRHLTKDVLRAILHSILFHRLFGTVKPKTFEILDVTMVCCVGSRSGRTSLIGVCDSPE